MAEMKKSWKFLVVLAILGGLYGAFPHIAARVIAGSSWQGVAPELTGDSLFYMTRAYRAIHGDIMGNPHYLTPYKNPSPSLTLVDSIEGIPYAFLPPFWAAALDTFLWNAIFALLLGILLLRLGFSRSMIILAWFIIATSMFRYMLRVGHTQIMFPYFLVFFILLLEAWRKDRVKTTGKHDALLLGLCAGLTPYLYTFLFQSVAVSLAVGVALAFLLRRRQLMRSFALSIGVMIAIATPNLFYLVGIMNFPGFGEAMNLMDGVRSHVPPPQIYFFGRWLLLLVAWSLALWLREARVERKKADAGKEEAAEPSLKDRVFTISVLSLVAFGVTLESIITGFDIFDPGYASWLVLLLLVLWSFPLWLREVRVARKKADVGKEEAAEPSLEDAVFTISMLSLGAFGVMMQMVITGIDIHTVGHINFFVLPLLLLGLVLFIGRSVRALFEKGFYAQKALLLLFLLVVAREIWSTIPPQFPHPYLNPSFYRSDSAGPQYVLRPAGNPQYIMPALQALRSLSGTQVIAAPEPLNAYIPLYTGQYVLFSYTDGGIYGAPDIVEIADRLFTSKLRQPLTRESVAEAYSHVEEVPNSLIAGRNELVRKLCAMVSRSPSCSTLVVAWPYSGDEEIDHPALFVYYQNIVRPNVVKYLLRFNVSQLVIDRRLPTPELLRGETPWYSDPYYAIYDVTQITR